jgi:Na+/H+-translocating membrane pyrophosphatase
VLKILVNILLSETHKKEIINETVGDSHKETSSIR